MAPKLRDLEWDKLFLDLKFNISSLSKVEQTYLVADKYENKHEA